MGSVVMGDVLPDFPRYTHKMGGEDTHPGPDTHRASPLRAQHSQSSVHSQVRQRTASATSSTSGASSSQTFTRSTYQQPRSNVPSSSTSSRRVSEVAQESQHREERVPEDADHGSIEIVDAADGSGYDDAGEVSSTPPSPRLLPTLRSSLSLAGSTLGSPTRIKVRNLSHIQSFASEEVLTRSRHEPRYSLTPRPDGGQQYEISSMPVGDIIEMVARLLTKITSTNDGQQEHDHLHRHLPPSDGTSGLSQQTASVLSFHGKNVPSITILSYLSRIHKYCPTTYEVFLSLLVYFDRMTETVNSGTIHSFRTVAEPEPRPLSQGSMDSASSNGPYMHDRRARSPPSVMPTPPSSTGKVNASHESQDRPGTADSDAAGKAPHVFVVDSFNIHRLVIAGVTCASKFFSDVFYTNSRYAKVGGLPVPELNHLELQFLLLNDFRLSVPVEELEAYGSMLVEFYAKEVIAQQMTCHSSDALYMAHNAPTANA